MNGIFGFFLEGLSTPRIIENMIENHKDKSKSSQIHHEKTISLPNAHIFPKLFSNTIFSHSFSIENLTFELLPTLLVP
jgi:hypothetical protein